MTFSPSATLMIAAQAPVRRRRRGDRAVAGGADRRKLPRTAAGDGAGRAGLRARRRRRAAFLIGGILGTYIGWRPAFGILIAVSAHRLLLSFRLKPDKGRPDVQIDVVGVVLAAAAIILISFGFNNLNGGAWRWRRPERAVQSRSACRPRRS